MVVKWIKIVTDIFDDEKIVLIESLPSADSIIVIWFKLLCLAGKSNNGGVFVMNDRIAYTDEMLSTIFRRDINTVRLALKTFETYGMIEIIDGVYTIPNWNKHQSLDKLEQRKEYMKKYMQEYRQEQAAGKKLKEDIQKVVEAWNTLESLGIKAVSRIREGTNRWNMLKARIDEYGVEEVLQAIENVRASDFCRGRGNKGWWITFDWFVKPNNFPKVLEGVYANRIENTSTPTQRMMNESYKMMDEWACEGDDGDDKARVCEPGSGNQDVLP